jgi:hypothetical protein
MRSVMDVERRDENFCVRSQLTMNDEEELLMREVAIPRTAATVAPASAPVFPWGGLLILAAAGFTAVTTELLPSGLLPQISRDLGVDESAVGSLTAAYAAVIVFTDESPVRRC